MFRAEWGETARRRERREGEKREHGRGRKGEEKEKENGEEQREGEVIGRFSLRASSGDTVLRRKGELEMGREIWSRAAGDVRSYQKSVRASRTNPTCGARYRNELHKHVGSTGYVCERVMQGQEDAREARICIIYCNSHPTDSNK